VASPCARSAAASSYEISTRRKFKCKGCTHQFSVTSGTIFASRKMSFCDLLGAICIFVNAVKGLSGMPARGQARHGGFVD
jgi:transposase-like protein